MKWVTREHVHLDRVACPWLIKRFIDQEAEFVFVPWGKEDERPADAIPFAIPGVELSPHDDDGSTFDKLMRNHNLTDPALKYVADLINSGIHQALHRGHKDEMDVPAIEGVGLNGLSEGIMLISDGDDDNIEKSMLVYDAFYAWSRAKVLVQEEPSLLDKPLLERSALLKARLGSAAAP